MGGLFGDDEVLVILLNIFGHTVSTIEFEQHFSCGITYSVEHKLYLFDIFFRRVDLLIYVLFAPLFRKVVSKCHMLIDGVYGIALVSHDG